MEDQQHNEQQGRRFIVEEEDDDNCDLYHKGKDGVSKTDEFSEKFQTAFDPPPLIFGKSCCAFRDKSAYVQYGGTVVYYMILFPMRCM